MTIEQVNTEIEKRISKLKSDKDGIKSTSEQAIHIKDMYSFAIKELEAIQKLTNVIPSRSSQPVNVIEK